MKTAFFPLNQVRLLDGPFQHIAGMHARYLLDEVDPDRLLTPFLEQAGLPPKKERYGDWELSSLAGHSLGHYLTATSLLYASTGNPSARERVNYLVSELARCQLANGDGYVMPIRKQGFLDIGAGKLDVQPFFLNGLWAPFYVVHKVLAGVRDAHVHAADPHAAAMAESLIDFFLRLVKGLDDSLVRQMLVCEHGGIYEILLEWADLLKKDQWLPLIRHAFYDSANLDELKTQSDHLSGKHCNTLIPKVLGMAKNHELTGDPGDAAAAEFFFRRVTTRRSFVNGSFGESEHFFPEGHEPEHLTPWTGEGCNTCNMLKLARRLFEWHPRHTIIDYVERTLINHVAANIGRKGGEFGYFLGLGSLGHKVFSRPQSGWWCCVGTGMENPVRYGEMIYSRLADGIAVNLYFASRLRDQERQLILTCHSSFPLDEKAEFTLELKKSATFTLAFRRPEWCSGMTLEVNGIQQETILRRGYFHLKRRWCNGDKVKVLLPFSLRCAPLRGSRGKTVAVLYGPLLLAGITPLPKGERNEAKLRWTGHIDARGKMDGIAPVITAGTPERFLKTLQPMPRFGEFRSRGSIRPRDLRFKPFFRVYEEYYSIFFPVMTKRSWLRRRAGLKQEAERRRMIELRRIDAVHPGFQQSEVDHHFAGTKTDTGENLFRKWRRAQPGGTFSYLLKCQSSSPLELAVITYGGEWADHRVRIYADGCEIGELCPNNSRPGEWVESCFPLPPEITAGKTHCEFRFSADDTLDSGRIFDLELRISDSSDAIPRR